MSATGSSVGPDDIRRLQDTLAAAQRGDLPRAFALAEAALDDGLAHPFLFKMRALHHEQQGRLEDAVSDFQSAVADAPNDPAALNALGLCLGRVGRFAESLAALDGALVLQPDFATCHANRGWVLENLGELAGARAAYRRACAIDPANVRALGGLASLAARSGDGPAARDYATQALAASPSDPAANLALAMADLSPEAAADAEQRMRGLLARPDLPVHERGVALSVLGDALDLQDRTAEAFAAYSAGNAALRDLYRTRVGQPGFEAGSDMTARLAREFEAAAGDWRARASASADIGGVRGHVFLVGFPRSGTTLMGQVLAAHPGAATLDEQELLGGAAGAFLTQPGGLDRLARLEDGELDPVRRAYWDSIRRAAPDLGDRVLVDKLPMNTLGLPLIARLFPDARVVFARRDPRDVVLSCFRRQFVINGANWEFLSLDGAARFYDSVMQLAELYRAGLPDLQVRIQGYEDLVGQFDLQAADLCRFIGLEPDAELSGFAGRGGLEDIATPSARQLGRGLSAEGVGRWRSYRAELAPVLPRLDPWVARFGYEAE